MYVTTFYSFKGGVGRTMALVNIAVDLVRRGRRVLVVDFDLEAPGLDTFDVLRLPGAMPGLVDFVSRYLGTGQAPDVGEFVVEVPGVGNERGKLWIMPSGAQRAGYARTLAQIDWSALYEQHDGYLLFEDLKEQWQASVKPDYVLVDSRTGHTDVGGICTRQLPDAVAILFFPNVQNLRGLTKVVRDIRAERTGHRTTAIELHFVMSNVPDLDDEDRILAASIDSFQNDLGFEQEPLVIHRYDSLSLLNQVIFTKDRPRSRLAKEYTAVTEELIRHNPQDRAGALDYVRRMRRMRRMRRIPGSPGPSLSQMDVHLEKIEANHGADGEVLFRLGLISGDDGSFEDAAALFDRAIESGYRDPEVYLRRAYVRLRERGDRDGASQDAVAALQCLPASPAQVRRALTMITSDQLRRVADSASVTSLPPGARVWIARDLNQSRGEAETAREMLRSLLAEPQLSSEDREHAQPALVLASIALGRFAEAIEVIRSKEPDVSRMSIHCAFNYGMAVWGEHGQVTREPFVRTVQLERSDPREDQTPNYLQCMAISFWAVGEKVAAQRAAENARMQVSARGGKEFSCWRYLRVSAAEFEQDIEEMLRLIGGDDSVTPRFMSKDRRVPVNWPTHLLPATFWEELGRTVASFGSLEETVKRANFAITATRKYATEKEVEAASQKWPKELETSMGETLADLTKRIEKTLKQDNRFPSNETHAIVSRLKSVSDSRNELSHGTWTDYEAESELAELLFSPRKGWQQQSARSVSQHDIAVVRREAVDIALYLIDAVTSRGIQFPGSNSPGREVLSSN